MLYYHIYYFYYPQVLNPTVICQGDFVHCLPRNFTWWLCIDVHLQGVCNDLPDNLTVHISSITLLAVFFATCSTTMSMVSSASSSNPSTSICKLQLRYLHNCLHIMYHLLMIFVSRFDFINDSSGCVDGLKRGGSFSGDIPDQSFLEASDYVPDHFGMVNFSILVHEGGYGSEFSVGGGEVLTKVYPSLEVLCIEVPFANGRVKFSSLMQNKIFNVDRLD